MNPAPTTKTMTQENTITDQTLVHVGPLMRELRVQRMSQAEFLCNTGIQSVYSETHGRGTSLFITQVDADALRQYAAAAHAAGNGRGWWARFGARPDRGASYPLFGNDASLARNAWPGYAAGQYVLANAASPAPRVRKPPQEAGSVRPHSARLFCSVGRSSMSDHDVAYIKTQLESLLKKRHPPVASKPS